MSSAAGIVRSHPVRVDDLDGFGIVYHAKFIAMLDHVISDFWEEAGWRFTGESGPVIRALNLEYLAPISVLGPVDIRFAITRRGTTSVTYGFEFFRGETVYARGERTSVMVDRSGTPFPIPDELWAAAGPLLEPAA